MNIYLAPLTYLTCFLIPLTMDALKCRVVDQPLNLRKHVKGYFYRIYIDSKKKYYFINAMIDQNAFIFTLFHYVYTKRNYNGFPS